MKFITRCGLETRETKHVGLTDQTHGNFALVGENVFSSILIFFRRTHRSLRHLPWGSLGGKRGNGCSETEMQQKCNNVIMLATK